jgi:hypothetical protein
MNGSKKGLAGNQVIKDLICPVSDARDRRSPLSLQVQQLKCHLGVCRVIAQLSELRIDVPSWPDVIPFVQERAKQGQIGRVNRRALRVRLQLSDPVNSHRRQVSLPTRGMNVDAWISGAPLAWRARNRMSNDNKDGGSANDLLVLSAENQRTFIQCSHGYHIIRPPTAKVSAAHQAAVFDHDLGFAADDRPELSFIRIANIAECATQHAATGSDGIDILMQCASAKRKCERRKHLTTVLPVKCRDHGLEPKRQASVQVTNGMDRGLSIAKDGLEVAGWIKLAVRNFIA